MIELLAISADIQRLLAIALIGAALGIVVTAGRRVKVGGGGAGETSGSKTLKITGLLIVGLAIVFAGVFWMSTLK